MMSVEAKSPAPAAAETRGLLPLWLAYAASGLTFVAAAYLWTSIPAFLSLYSDLGIAVPGLVKLQLSYPKVLPLVMIVLGLLALVATRPRVPAGSRGRASSLLAATASVGLMLFAILMVLMNAVTVRSLQQIVGDQSTWDELHLDRKLGWATSLSRRPVSEQPQGPSGFSTAGKGEQLATVFDALAKQAGVRIRVAYGAGVRPCRTPVSGLSFERALGLLTRTHEVRVYRVSDEDLILVPAHSGSHVTKTFQEEPLGSAVEAIRSPGLTVALEPGVEGRKVSFALVAAPRREALEILAVLSSCRVVERANGGLLLEHNP